MRKLNKNGPVAVMVRQLAIRRSILGLILIAPVFFIVHFLSIDGEFLWAVVFYAIIGLAGLALFVNSAIQFISPYRAKVFRKLSRSRGGIDAVENYIADAYNQGKRMFASGNLLLTTDYLVTYSFIFGVNVFHTSKLMWCKHISAGNVFAISYAIHGTERVFEVRMHSYDADRLFSVIKKKLPYVCLDYNASSLKRPRKFSEREWRNNYEKWKADELQ